VGNWRTAKLLLESCLSSAFSFWMSVSQAKPADRSQDSPETLKSFRSACFKDRFCVVFDDGEYAASDLMARQDIAMDSIRAIGADILKSQWSLHVGQSAHLKSEPGNADRRRKARFRVQICRPIAVHSLAATWPLSLFRITLNLSRQTCASLYLTTRWTKLCYSLFRQRIRFP
jgi:hypothetical protein